ncbi:MAG: ribonuclease P protein component [Parachlamydiales bacterium]
MKFPKSARLLKSREFTRLYQEKNRFVSSFFYLDYKRAKRSRLGISASKAFGKAHLRNRFKRLIREAFRSQISTFPLLEINVIPKKAALGTSLKEIKQELERFQKGFNHAKQLETKS